MYFDLKIHLRRSIRIKGFDYAQKGLYFLTLACQNRKHFFGEVVDGQMILNNAGEIAKACWLEIPRHFPNVVLHEFVIMPDHVHGIIEITSRISSITESAFQRVNPNSIASIVRGYKTGVTKWFRRQGDMRKVWLRNYYVIIVTNIIAYGRISDYIKNNPSKWGT